MSIFINIDKHKLVVIVICSCINLQNVIHNFFPLSSILHIALNFGGRVPRSKQINIDSDCSIQDETIKLYSCATPDLADYPLEDVTLNVKGLVKLHVFGMPCKSVRSNFIELHA